MMTKTSALAAFLLLALAPVEDAPRFAVKEGSVLEKSFATEGTLALQDSDLRLNGEDADPEQMGLPADLEVSFGFEVACQDTYESVSEARPLALLRAFEGVRFRAESQDGEREDEEHLAGRTVRFDWKADDEAYAKSFVGDPGDDEDLDLLREDLDLRSLLPADTVDEGDTWSVDGLGMLELWLPGIDVRGKLDAEALGDVPPEVVESLLGVLERISLECTWEGEVEEDGVRLGRIGLAAEVGETVPIDPAFATEDPEAPPMEWKRFEVTIDLDLEGTLLWNQAEGRFASFESKSEGALKIDVDMAIPDFSLTIAGSVTFSLDVEHHAHAG